MPKRTALIVLPFLTCWVCAQDQAEAAERSRSDRALEKTRSLLFQQPTHAVLFDRYFKMLVGINAVGAEVTALKERLEKDPADTAASVVLGRVLLRSGEEEAALETLDAIPAKSAEIQGVLGDIYLKLARFDMATRALEASLPAARTSEAKAAVYEKLGRALLALNQKEPALATWRRIGELDGGSFLRRLRVAELLADSGMLDEASKEYEPLLRETDGDPPQHCRVLRDYGRLLELRGQLDEALTTYQRIFDLTDRGNWLRKDVEVRTVQIFRRTGRLPDLVARLREDLGQSPDDLATVELLSTVLTEMRDLEGATTILQRAVPRFPKDVRLARRLAELYLEQDKVDAAIAEYQRILSEKPDELELYLELGQLFAKSERFNEAKNQWEKALAHNLTDATLCTRIASMYAMWGRQDDAIRLFERAIELEPEAMVRYTDLAEFLFAQDRREDGIAVLDRALAKAAAQPRRLEVLAGVLREHDLVDRARKCLGDWLALEPDNSEARYALADLYIDAGDVEAARPLLWQVAEQDDRGSGHRTMAANTLVGLAVRTKTLDKLIADAKDRDSAGADFVLGRAHARSRDFEAAINAYRSAIVRKPDDSQSRLLLARLLAEEGDLPGALGEYGKLAMISAGERRRHFREIARLHVEMYDLEAAIDVWRTAMRDNPDNAAVFLEVGREFLDIQRVQEALDAFQQAVRLRPRDPDIQFRLADALRQAGKYEDAEEQLLSVATTALDDRDREQARAKLFELYGEQGSIELRIEQLRTSVAENPYDKDAPQLLGDLYRRTGDYALGLEMVERALGFQPRNRELLARRADLLEALDEWDSALEVHRELLKFPDADRDVQLAGIGVALYELGRAHEAKEAFAQIRDRGRVSKLYEKYDLHDEAIDYFQRAIARNPADLRSYVALAESLVKRNRRPDAIQALQKALNIRPYYREALRALGKLYVQEGRREDAVAVGMRLFGLRGEQVEQSRREEYEEEQEQRRNWWYYGSYRNSFSQQRLNAAQGYFSERGLNNEWGEILVAEARRRPADETLLGAVRSHYGWRDKSASKLSMFLLGVLSADREQMRVPPGYTKNSYLQRVEGYLVGVWQQDAAVAEARLAELAAAGDDVAVELQRATLLRCLGKLDDMEVVLRRILTQSPQEPVALAMLVDRLVDEKRYAESVEPLRSLAAFWDSDSGAAAAAEIEAREQASFRRNRKSMLDDLPRKVRRRITDAALQMPAQRTRAPSWSKLSTFSFPEAAPQKFAVLCKLVRVHKAMDDAAGLAAAVEAARAAAATMGERSALGQILFQEGVVDVAEALLLSVMADAREIHGDPVQVYFWDQYRGTVSAAADDLGQMLAKKGRILDAYEVMRENGHGEKAELLIREHDKVADVKASLEASLGATAAALRAARDSGASEIRSIELDYRDAVIKLADFHMGEKDYPRAEEIYAAALALLPDELDVRNVLVQLRLRRGDAESAIAMHEEIIAAKRRLKRAAAGETALPPTRLRPTVPGESSESVVRSPGSGYYWSPGGAGARQFNVAENYLGILQIHRDRNENDGVLDILQRLTREDPTTFRQMVWEVLDIVRNQDLGKKKLSILRILKSAIASDEWLTLEYAKACREEGELKEAKRSLEKLIADAAASNDYYVEQATQELEKVDQKLGEHKVTVDELLARVAEDPENVRQRLKLAERLRKDNRYAECLEQARAIVERAPYMSRAKELVVETAAAIGEDDVAKAMMRRLFDEATETYKKLERGVSLANWLYAEGKVEEAYAIVEGLETESGGSYNFSPGNWFLDRHEKERAIPLLEQELEKQQGNSWYVDQVRPRLIRIELSANREVAAVRRLLENIDDAGSLADREQRWKDLLQAVKGYPYPEKLHEKLSAEFGKRESAGDCLVMAACEFARGRPEAGEAELRRALDRSSKEVHLFPLLLGLRRLNDDMQGALDVLDRMATVYGGSDTRQYTAGVSLSQRDSLKIEKANILWDMGKADAARQMIESLVDDTDPSTLSTVAQIYANRKEWETALQWRRRYFDRKGTRNKSDLLAEANILIELERYGEALELAKQARLMARGDGSARGTLTNIHRELGSLDQWVKDLEADYAKDPRDSGLRGSLLGLYAELEDHAARRRIYEGMLPQQDLREEALDGLITLCSELSLDEERLGYMIQKLELKGGDEKKSLYREIGDLEAELELWAPARAHYEQALDLETADGWMDLANWLEKHDRDDEALEAFRKAFELDKKKREVLAKEAAAAHKARDFATALAKALEYLRESRGMSRASSYQELFLNVLDALPAGEREAMLRGEPGDAKSMERAALLQVARCDYSAAEAAAQKALELEPGSFLAMEARCAALAHQERWRELIDATEAFRVWIEREFMITAEWNYQSRAEGLQDAIGRYHHLLGDDAAAEAAWRQQPLRRSPYNYNAMGSWRSDWSVRYTADHWLGVDRPARALEALDYEFLLREQPPWNTYLRALVEVGRAGEAETLAWQRVDDPLELYGVSSRVGGTRYYYGGEDDASSGGMIGFLLWLYDREGRLDELTAKCAAMQQVPATRRQGEKLEQELAERRKNWEFLADAYETQLAEQEKEKNPTSRLEAARRWARAKNFTKALDHLKAVFDFDSPGLKKPRMKLPTSGYEYERVYYGTGGAVPSTGSSTGSNPFSFTFQGSSRSGYYGYSSWRRNEGVVGHRAFAAALLRLTGDDAKAQEIEEALQEEARGAAQKREASNKVAQAYLDHGLFEHAARCWQWQLDHADELDLDTGESLTAVAQLHAAVRRQGGDGARLAAVQQAWRQLLDRSVDEAPGPYALAAKRARVRFLVTVVDDPEAARDELDWLLRYDPLDHQLLMLAARAARLAGDPQKTVAIYEQVRELRRRAGSARTDPAADRAEWAMALHDLGETDKAAEELRRALDDLPDDGKLTDEVRAKLAR